MEDVKSRTGCSSSSCELPSISIVDTYGAWKVGASSLHAISQEGWTADIVKYDRLATARRIQKCRNTFQLWQKESGGGIQMNKVSLNLDESKKEEIETIKNRRKFIFTEAESIKECGSVYYCTDDPESSNH